MSRALHAPAPWEVSLTDDTVVVRKDAHGVQHVIAEISGDYNEPDLWPVMEANARLIAAAPDLLAEAIELLRNATYADGQATVLTQDCEALEAAIARAGAA